MIGHYPSRGDLAVAPASEGPSLRGFDRATRPRHDDHQGHSHYLILSAGLPGFGPRELALIAQIVRYDRKGTPDLDDLRPFARPGDRELVQRCALLLRLAELLEIGEDQSVRKARLVRDGSSVRLLLEGDGHLALWNARRQMGDWAFRRVFGHRLVFPR